MSAAVGGLSSKVCSVVELNGPSCGNSECARLATGIWPDLFKSGRGSVESWLERRELECETCAAERVRRCCVLQNNSVDHQRYIADPFAGAPYVHPYRYPAFHATQLRAIVFAKSKNKRLLWVTAHDQIVAKNVNMTKAREEQRKELWLGRKDRDTGGIPGLLPLVLDLPVRLVNFIEAPPPN